MASLMTALFVKDWLQYLPGFKWLWPRAWEEKGLTQQQAREARSDTEGHPMTDMPPGAREMREMLTQLHDLQSVIKRGEDALRTWEEDGNAREEWCSRTESLLEREDQLLTELQSVSENLHTWKDALPFRREGGAIRERTIRRAASNLI
ncbi:hypothetical protein BJX61DRAFT_545939 [Aspergillus egyptiacus]|nr:hypothetical protein BJX61DRAFT_545939 [Aspergillus egyptiacus]